MKLTEYRTMLYLPHALYAQTLLAAKRQKKSLAAVIRDALSHYLQNPPKGNYLKSLRVGFGLWKDRRGSGVDYENRLRSQWKNRE